MHESQAAEVCGLVSRWCAIRGRTVRVYIGSRLRIPDCDETLKGFLARHGYAVIDGFVCEEALWRRT